MVTLDGGSVSIEPEGAPFCKFCGYGWNKREETCPVWGPAPFTCGSNHDLIFGVDLTVSSHTFSAVMQAKIVMAWMIWVTEFKMGLI